MHRLNRLRTCSRLSPPRSSPARARVSGASKWRRIAAACFLYLLIPGTLEIARGDLILANYNAAHPIKIMPIGDSITDDCEVNGAWRQYLQPLLTSNGIPFIFVGRQTSSRIPGFTQLHHEGYCGAVIAFPGVYAAHQYSLTDNYLQKIVPDALAIATNVPDIALILIGANDIGRGRDPNFVATNDMPNLLNLIFSNAPNANVILAKITSLESANILGYGSYATNVPIYNAALQTMVNQRRALGQNVSLADMYSVVDYNTMFMTDHVHPNTLGLKAVAAEWLARIQAITIRTNQFTRTLIHGGSAWNYSDAGQDLGTNWAQPGFDDSGWSNGTARLGYNELTDSSIIGFGPDPLNKFVTTYFLDSFCLPWNEEVTNLNFRLAQTDGAVVWLNGQELFSTNMPAGPITYTTLARSSATLFPSFIFYPTDLAPSNLTVGTNLLAVEIHQSAVTNASLGFDLELIGSGNIIPTPSLLVSPVGSDVQLSWPAIYGNSFNLYSTTNLIAGQGWNLATATLLTNGSQIVATLPMGTNAEFFRLQH